MAASAEIFNFIEKFTLMTSQGFQANLTFSSNQGRVSVNFNADLGCLTSNSTNYPQQPYVKSTQARRRQRRAQARKEQQSTDTSVKALKPDLTNIHCDETRDASTLTTEDSATNKTFSESVPTFPTMPLSKDDTTIEYLIPQPSTDYIPVQPYSQSNELNVPSTSPSPTPKPKMCCPSPCCGTKYSSARNCPGPDVLKTTYIRCCYHQ